MLIVDDDTMVMDILAFEMQDLGFEVTVAYDGKEGLEHFKKGSFDVVLTDYKMPNMDGLEMVKNILAIDPNIPIVMLSGFFDSEVEEKAQSLGVLALIEKPLNPDHIQKIFKDLGMIS